ncbi:MULTISPECIES: iron chelate uptake ABC transporter family permease subunit [unclassified Actinomyces]|uniref:iron chelate uptake ABC transporter family permease subunit n=1 Tax=unclassified Actinomyces TaxID=2609248 RepID=UPI002017B48E|nr:MULTISPECIES: iron chelate uptake ABC transporter family permease subunit [unclassified Actinomyces]MCL3777185.1 iron chelate uptake ABC transporter family permease subunit [Actinomyces sp. AC-20-1]MCL3788991.1 iron chelate uptake ABC transporter family permease subunit [Actinomyces sp. 187325]MCL3791346.1 iron chelate uptake ABC transporter family permease subunit [Actinomyces sp. 186855]MCL3793943.1 iron chelate uptake ABC transporter family permease subunit [Actinomyces sp. 217892]
MSTTHAPGSRTAGPARAARCGQPHGSGAFPTASARRRWWLTFLAVSALALLSCLGLLAWDNPMEPGTRGFWLIAQRRANAVVAVVVVAVCQAMATVAFQTVTGNRILTPSIMGFEALYRTIHTSTVFFLGAAGLTAARTTTTFVGQLLLMVAMCLLLYSWLLTSRGATLHAMLLLGVVIGAGLGSVATFMQRLLTPSEFDVLTARLFGSVNNADPDYYPIALPMVALGALTLALWSRRLNVLALGRETATSLGLSHRRWSVAVLVVVSVLMATSTALVGPMTFLGFLVSTLAYQLSGTFDHRYVMPMAMSLGVLVLTGAYFLMHHVFSAQGVVSIIIELVGGLTFLVVILRKGRL